MQLILERPDYEFFLRRADGRSALVNERTPGAIWLRVAVMGPSGIPSTR